MEITILLSISFLEEINDILIFHLLEKLYHNEYKQAIAQIFASHFVS